MTDAPAAGEKAIARRIKDHVVGSRHDFFAVVHPGFEETARQELLELGIQDPKVLGTGGIGFSARLDDAWRVNLGAGTVSRLLLRLCHFKSTGFGEFRARLAAFPWELYIADRAAIRFVVRTSRSRLWHEGKLQEEAAKAIHGRMAVHGRQVDFSPAAENEAARSQAIFIRLDENRCQVSLDSSGELLYRRGYGKFTEEAPLRETLACCVLRAAAVANYKIVLDPFCGSGTFALEAGVILSGRPVNSNRAFAFEGWPSFRPGRFRHQKEEMEREFKERAPAGPRKLYSSDIDSGAAATTRHNLESAGLASLAEVDQADFFRLHPPACDPADVLLVMNPPYGARLEKGTDIAALYRRIGDKVRRDYPGCGYAIIVPGLELEKALGLPHEKKFLFRNGGIGVALLIHSPRNRTIS
jgi:putative N6-adenine-specific DNA methylase